MPRKFLMHYEGSPQFRWYKTYKKTTYKITCDDLNAPRDELLSYQQANQFWLKKKAEIDLASISPEEQIRKAKLDKLAQFIERAGVDPLQDENWIFLQQVHQNLDKIDLPIIDKTKTLKNYLDQFLNNEKTNNRPATYDQTKRFLNATVNYLGNDLDASKINEQIIQKHDNWISTLGVDNKGKNKRLASFARFIDWLWSSKILMEKPRNYRDKHFKIVKKAIKKFENVKEELNNLDPKYKLWALLGLNCGMTFADLGALTWDMIDLEAGTLTRKRVKTSDHENVPTVTYKLFPATLELLKAIPKVNDLLYPGYYKNEYVDDDTQKTDLFTSQWQRMKYDYKITQKNYRSISATILKKKNIYRWAEKVFLAHAPESVADVHYGAEHDEPFFEALDFIRQELTL